MTKKNVQFLKSPFESYPHCPAHPGKFKITIRKVRLVLSTLRISMKLNILYMTVHYTIFLDVGDSHLLANFPKGSSFQL